MDGKNSEANCCLSRICRRQVWRAISTDLSQHCILSPCWRSHWAIDLVMKRCWCLGKTILLFSACSEFLSNFGTESVYHVGLAAFAGFMDQFIVMGPHAVEEGP